MMHRVTALDGSLQLRCYYTESWQRIESRPGGESSTQGVSLFVFGIRYIDDIVMRQRDANASGPPEERRYYLTDANYNVVMLVTDSGWGVERVFYTAYGEPEVFPFGDADGDYDVDTADQTLITAIKNGSQPYNILADLNLDGAVTQADLNAFSNYSGALGGRGVLTASNGSATTGNDIGYAGYLWNDERSQWHVRHREYDPKLGRWLQRDAMDYDDSGNLYSYVAGRAVTLVDMLGRYGVLPQDACFDAVCTTDRVTTEWGSAGHAAIGDKPIPTKTQKPTKNPEGDNFHAKYGAYYEYVLVCQYGCATIRTSYSGWTHDISTLMETLRNSGGCCLSSFMISTHHAGGVVYADKAVDSCPDSTFIDSITLCDGAKVDLNMCNSCDIAEQLRDNHPGIEVEIECTDGENRHWPVFDIDLPGARGEDRTIRS